MKLNTGIAIIIFILIQSNFAMAASIGERVVSGRITLRQAALRVIPQRPLDLAFYYLDNNARAFLNKNYLTVIDYRLPSNRKRMFVLNLRTGAVESLLVAHGKGSDPNQTGVLQNFSNEPNSLASSMGIYRVAETYNGEHGYSVRLDGLQATNSNARARTLVIHGADYVNPNRRTMGRSWGCPAIELSRVRSVVDALKGGSLLFVYGSQFESLIRK